MTTNLYTSRIECISMEIENALGEFVDDFDVERFADTYIEYDGSYYWLPLAPEQFWAAMQGFVKPTQEDQEGQEDQEDSEDKSESIGLTFSFSRGDNSRCYLHAWTETNWTAYGIGERYDYISKTLCQMAYSDVTYKSARKVIERYGFKLESIR